MRREITRLGEMATEGLTGKAAQAKYKGVCDELVALVRAVVEAASLQQAEAALTNLMAHPLDKGLAHKPGRPPNAAVVRY